MSRTDRRQMVPLIIACSVTLAFSLAGAPELRAQKNPDLVPIDVVRALILLPFEEDAETDILVGALPEPLNALDLPEGSEVIGSLVKGGFYLSHVRLDQDETEAVRDLERRLQAAGWARAEAATPGPERGGFAPRTSYEVPLVFCSGEGQQVTFSISPEDVGGSMLTMVGGLDTLTDAPFGGCGEPPPPARRYVREDGPLPSLEPPEGARLGRSGSGGGGDEWEADAVLSGLAPRELVEHYDRQLRAVGWEPLERLSSGGAAVLTYVVTDGQDDRWHAVLAATSPADSDHALLTLHMRRLPLR